MAGERPRLCVAATDLCDVATTWAGEVCVMRDVRQRDCNQTTEWWRCSTGGTPSPVSSSRAGGEGGDPTAAFCATISAAPGQKSETLALQKTLDQKSETLDLCAGSLLSVCSNAPDAITAASVVRPLGPRSVAAQSAQTPRPYSPHQDNSKGSDRVAERTCRARGVFGLCVGRACIACACVRGTCGVASGVVHSACRPPPPGPPAAAAPAG